MAAPGAFAGRYVIQALLGSGGNGEVYRAWDSTEQDDVALKLLSPTGHPLGQWVEAVILRRLSDRHILPIRNADVHLGQPYLVTDIAAHGTVLDKITPTGRCGLPLATAVHWTRQACHGVARGHDAGVVHNDLKPENLFVTSGNDALVADFGMAGGIDPATGLAFAHGATPTTVAPEVAATWGTGISAASTRSDVYSLGASAFWMLTGMPPHEPPGHLSMPDKMAWVAAATAPRLRDVAPHVPQRVAAAVEKAMARAAADRFAGPLAFAAALGARATETRVWVRTDEHTGHLGCWRGTKAGVRTYVMCMEVGTTAARRSITTVTDGAGRRVSAGCDVATASSWPTVMRRLIRSMT